MRAQLDQIESTFSEILTLHGVELVALEWLQGGSGGGHGVLRVTIDQPGGDPRIKDVTRSVGIDTCARATRDLSTALDTMELGDSAYTLEVGSPGSERPLHKRADFDRFSGLQAFLQVRIPINSRPKVTGFLRGTIDRAASDGGYAVKIECDAVVHEVPRVKISRAHLLEIKTVTTPRPRSGKANKVTR